jgi:serine protease Do
MLDHTVTAGIISATGRNNLPLPGMDENAYQDFLQTDAAINPGNSGGPLIDLSGKIVGINTAILTASSFGRGQDGVSQSGGFEGIGLAIPASMAKRVVADLIKNGKVIRGFFGVQIHPVPADVAKDSNLPDGRGALVTTVQPGSPADKAGLQAGDIVVALDGREVADHHALRIRAAETVPGTEVNVDLVRGRERRSVKLVVGEQPGGATPALNQFGFRVREVPAGTDGDPKPGVVIDQVALGSPAARTGLRPGLRVHAVGDTEVHSLADFEKLVAGYNPAQGLPLRLRLPGGQVVGVVVGGQP